MYLDFIMFDIFCLIKTFISKTTSLRHVFEKVLSAKWPHKLGEMCLSKSGCLGFATKISNFTLSPLLLRFRCLTNSFYRRYLPCMYNISPIYRIYFIYSIHAIHSVIRSYMLGLLLWYFPCRVSSSHCIANCYGLLPPALSGNLRIELVPAAIWHQWTRACTNILKLYFTCVASQICFYSDFG